MSYIKESNDAQDIVQDVFINFIEKDSTHFNNEKALKTYLFNSVHNACMDRLKKKHITEFNIDSLKQEIVDNETLHLNEEIITQIQQDVSALPPQTQKVIIDIFMKNMKYKEVSIELNISINTVKTLLRDGLSKLRTKSKKYIEFLFFSFFYNR